MLIASGALLVLLTWLVSALALVSLGLLPVLLVLRRAKRASPVLALRFALWIGLLITMVFVLVTSMWWPMRSPAVAYSFIMLVLALGVPGWVLLHRGSSGRGRLPGTGGGLVKGGWLLWAALGLALVYLATSALGPVTNYDSGLYHLGAIGYASNYPTIPGLANLYFAFGYGSVEFPLAAFLGNGPWQGEGYRLLNGLLLSLAVLDLWLRARDSRRSPGFTVLLVGILATFVPMVALSDYWVTSPTQDSAALTLTVVATAYLADAALGRGRWFASGFVACIIGIELILVRTTMLAFALASFALLVALIIRRHVGWRAFTRPLVVLVGLGILALAAAIARDRILSGWLQFPLSVFAFDVPWRSIDPTGERTATLGFHRDPANLWEAAQGWGWIGTWFGDRLQQWETYELVGLGLLAVVLAILAQRAVRPDGRWLAMCAAVAPSLIAVIIWWVATPPSYRFAWGPVFTLATVPIGWSLWLLSSRQRAPDLASRRWRTFAVMGVAAPILVVTVYSAVMRLDTPSMTQQREWRAGVSITYAVAPVTEPLVADFVTESGLVLLRPVDSEQCWARQPLCTSRPEPDLRLAGVTLAEGLQR